MRIGFLTPSLTAFCLFDQGKGLRFHLLYATARKIWLRGYQSCQTLERDKENVCCKNVVGRLGSGARGGGCGAEELLDDQWGDTRVPMTQTRRIS